MNIGLEAGWLPEESTHKHTVNSDTGACSPRRLPDRLTHGCSQKRIRTSYIGTDNSELINAQRRLSLKNESYSVPQTEQVCPALGLAIEKSVILT